MNKSLRVGLLGVAALTNGCADTDEGEDISAAFIPLSQMSDATTGGTPGFFFLAPLGNPPGVFPGTFDGSFKARLRIDIRNVDCNAQNTVGSLVRSVSPVLVYPSTQQYKVNITVNNGLLQNNCYRILPMLDNAPLGFRDIAVLASNNPTVPAGYKKWGTGSNQVIPFRLENMDPDGDTILSHVDNCPTVSNANQADSDNDGEGDACETDTDNDGTSDAFDNCPLVANPTQDDADNDGLGDACDACALDANNDVDTDGVCGDVDNCPGTANANQADADSDGDGDACDACPNDAANDADTDGVCGDVDNCPATANANQNDADSDGDGDACDACPNDAQNDIDTDGVCGDIDNCPTVPNANQADADNDQVGDACDSNCATIPGGVGAWQAEGNFNDSIGSANGVSTGTTNFAAGVFGQAFSFTSSYVKAPAFDLTGAFTLSFWARANTIQAKNTGVVSSSDAATDVASTFQIDWNTGGLYRFKAGSATELNVNIGPASTAQFQHIVVTYNGTTGITTYLDGVQTGTGVWTGPTLTFSAMKIGANRGQNLRYNGRIDDVRVFNRALSGLEVANLFAAPNGVCP